MSAGSPPTLWWLFMTAELTPDLDYVSNVPGKEPTVPSFSLVRKRGHPAPMILRFSSGSDSS